MTTFLAYEHSHPYWMVNNGKRRTASRAMPQPGVVPQIRKIRDLGLPIGTDAADKLIHVIVADAASRSQSSAVVNHIWSNIPNGSFCRVDNEFYVSTPESCFLQFAERCASSRQHCIADIAHQTEYGFMLCGTYAVYEGDGHYGLDQLTKAFYLRQYLDRANRAYGLTLARRAVNLVLNNSASPLEAKAVILLCFPPKLGGYGLPIPVLNYRVNLAKGLWDQFGKRYYKCDAYWPRGKRRTALEVDGLKYHTGKLRIFADTEKRNNLAAMGVQVIGATNAQLNSPEAVNKLARSVAKSIGYKIRDTSRDSYRKHEELWSCVMGPRQAEFLGNG